MRVSFGEYTVDADTRQITRGREELHLSPKAFQLLTRLIHARPAVVDRASLRQHIWPGTHVVDASLSNLVAEIRGVLGESSEGGPFVRTVHGVGYAFSGEAREAGPASGAGTADAPKFWLVWQERAIVLDQPETVIGRDPGCTVWIDAPGVSRRHARIRLAPGGAGSGAGSDVQIEDLDSTNGTYLRGVRLTQGVPLHDGDAITLGEAAVTFRARQRADAPTKRVRPPGR